MNVRELIEALSALDQDLPVFIRERGDAPQELYPPFERRSTIPGWVDHVLLLAKHKEKK